MRECNTVPLAQKSYRSDTLLLLSPRGDGLCMAFPGPRGLPVPWDADGGGKRSLT